MFPYTSNAANNGVNNNNNNNLNPNASLFGSSFLGGGVPGVANPGGFSFNNTGTGPAPSLFGGLPGQFDPNATLNGGLGFAPTTAPGQSAYFDHMLTRSRQQPVGNDGAKPPPVDNEFAQFRAFPDLHLGLGDIAQKVRDLGAGAAPGIGGGNTAHYLLAGSGVPTTSTLRDLSSIAARMGSTPAAQSSIDADTNIDHYVAGVASQTTLDIIGEGLEQAKRDFDSFLRENVHIQWDAQRRRIYEHFGLAKPSDNADTFAQSGAFGQSVRQNRPFAQTSTFIAGHRSVIGNPGAGMSVLGKSGFGKNSDDVKTVPTSHYDVALQREKQEKYMACVNHLNVSRKHNEGYPLIHKFLDVERTGGPQDNRVLSDAFISLIKVTGEFEEILPLSDPGAIRERQFARQYLSDVKGADTEIRKRILDGSRRALEESFLEKVEATLERYPREANVGGIPKPVHKIRAYINVGMARKEFGSEEEILQFQMLNDDYLWLLIYHLLRAGLAKAASEYVIANQRAIHGIDRNFPRIIAHYARDPEHMLPPNLQSDLIREWETQKKYPQEQVDPYRLACYKVLGRIELERRVHPNISLTHDHWTWLQFTLAREGSAFGLDGLRQSVLDIGTRHFSGGIESIDSPGTYFNMLILAGMYEKAVGWLYDFNPITAIHFSIALDYYGLLRVSDIAQNEVLVSQTDGTWKINFGLMVGHYTSDFRAAYPEIAVDYLSLICLDSDLPGQEGQRQVDLCHEALRELVLETREFTLLLGDVRENGERVEGAIEQRIELIKLSDRDTFFRKISLQAASVADDCGRISDAVILYHLSNDFDSVVKILNHTLADDICTDLGEETTRLDPMNRRNIDPKGKQPVGRETSLSLTTVENPADLAEKIYALYSTKIEIQKQVSVQNWEALVTLAKLARARSSVNTALAGDRNGPHLQTGAWEHALEEIRQTNVLPLEARGNISMIRTDAAKFNSFIPELARTIGPVLLFAVTACGRERERLRGSRYVDETKNMKIAELGQQAKDLMVFSGLVRYRLEMRVFEALARIGGDMDM